MSTATYHPVFVPGVPVPQGSAKAFVVRGRAVVTHANAKTMPWRSQMSAFIRHQVGTEILFVRGPVVVIADFVLPRRAAEPKRVTPAHIRKPDLDKLLRNVLDAMTGLVYTDDSQVVGVTCSKRTAGPGEIPGVRISWSGPVPT